MTHAAHPQFGTHGTHGTHSAQVRTASGLNFLAGIYLLISAWIAGANTGNHVNGIIAGIVVAVLAATRFSGAAGPWASWIDAIIGVWLVLSPWIYHYAGTGMQWNSIVVGIIMIVLGAWSAMAGDTSEPAAATNPRL